MSKVSFPSIRWHPDTGEMKVCVSTEDVPPGWLDHHPNDPSYATVAAPVEAPPPPVLSDAAVVDGPHEKPPLTRKQILNALTDGGIAPPQGATTKALWQLLLDNGWTDDFTAEVLAQE